MTKNRTIQLYRGTTAQNNAYTGSAGELTMDTTLNEIRIHDGTTAGGHKISSGYQPDLFDVKWADHEINDMAWLRGDTFSWQSGSTYSNAYNHLVADIAGKSLTTETIAGTTISFYLADDGHKICPANQESNVFTIVVATGIAWYYILDTTNQRFKLPVTEWGFVGLRSAVGKYVEPGLPNITGAITNQNHGGMVIDTVSGAFDKTTPFTAYDGGYSRSAYNFDFDASRCSSIYGNSTTVQPAATEMYLYFYVGGFTQTATENTAGLNASLFNGKADLNLLNTANNVDFIIERQEPSAENNYTWYRKYKSGWVEQGGFLNGTTSAVNSVTLPIEMADTNYTVNATLKSNTVAGSGGSWANGNAYSTTQIQIIQDYTGTWVGQGTYWTVFGISA